MLQGKSLPEKDVRRFESLDGSLSGGGDSSDKERPARRLEIAEEGFLAMEVELLWEARQGTRLELLRSMREPGGFSATMVEERLYGNGRHGSS